MTETITEGPVPSDARTDLGACYRLDSTETAPDGTTWETFTPSVHTASPWGPGVQHGGPVAGLLARAMEHCQPREDTRISRVVVEILGPVPLSQMKVRSWIERPGRRIELLAAELQAAHPDGTVRTVARARGWRLATADSSSVVHHADARLPFPASRSAEDQSSFPLPDAWRIGFVNAVDWQVVSPAGDRNTRSAAWLRLAHPLVEGETTSGLAETVALADIANGLGARLDPREWTFMNTELTVHLFEPPQGPWIGLECESSIGSDGVGMGTAVLHSESGPMGRAAQNLLVEKRADTV